MIAPISRNFPFFSKPKKDKVLVMEKDKEKHLRLLALAFYDNLYFDDSCETGSPSLDVKRPFGNSSYEGDVLEIIKAIPEDEEDGDKVWSRRQEEYARELYTVELTPYLIKHAKKYFKSLT